MTGTTKRIFMFLCALTVISFAVVGKMIFDSARVIANTSDRDKAIYELEAKLETMKGEQSDIRGQIDADKDEISSIESEIISLEEEMSILTAQSYVITQLYNEWLAVSQETQLEKQRLEQQKEYELEAFDSMLRMAYMHGDDTYFEMIFGSEDLGDFLSRTDMLAYHFQANDNVLSNLVETISDLDAANSQLEESMTKLGDFETQQTNILATLETRSADVAARKAELQANVETNEQKLADKNAEIEKIEADIKKLNEQQASQSQTPHGYPGSSTTDDGNGMFCIPTKNYYISSEFTYRISPITGKPESHNGLDMAAPYGTPIFAGADGTVIDSRYSSSWGNVVQINHGNGFVTLYAHCSARLVSTGQTVKRGETIALVGSTGWSTGNHLHFTVYKNGVAVNPRGYLSGV